MFLNSTSENKEEYKIILEYVMNRIVKTRVKDEVCEEYQSTITTSALE